MAGRGALVLCVGPSGAGKDTLLDGAAEALAETQRFHFAKRAITRPADAGGEDHIPMDEAEFLKRESEGEFLLSWRAHGLCYGIPKEPTTRLRTEGVSVIANVSRTVIDDARNRLQPASVVLVTASAETLAARLAARGRESAADVAARLGRAEAYDVSGRDVAVVSNDGSVESGVSAMVNALEAASSAEWEAAE